MSKIQLFWTQKYGARIPRPEILSPCSLQRCLSLWWWSCIFTIQSLCKIRGYVLHLYSLPCIGLKIKVSSNTGFYVSQGNTTCLLKYLIIETYSHILRQNIVDADCCNLKLESLKVVSVMCNIKYSLLYS